MLPSTIEDIILAGQTFKKHDRDWAIVKRVGLDLVLAIDTSHDYPAKIYLVKCDIKEILTNTEIENDGRI